MDLNLIVIQRDGYLWQIKTLNLNANAIRKKEMLLHPWLFRSVIFRILRISNAWLGLFILIIRNFLNLRDLSLFQEWQEIGSTPKLWLSGMFSSNYKKMSNPQNTLISLFLLADYGQSTRATRIHNTFRVLLYTELRLKFDKGVEFIILVQENTFKVTILLLKIFQSEITKFDIKSV